MESLYFLPLLIYLFYKTTKNWKLTLVCLLYVTGLSLTGVLPTLLTVSLTGIIGFILVQYMHTEIPEGVTEVWAARFLDTALRTNGKVINDREFDGVGVCVYEPVSLARSKRPVLIYFHGGGWSWLSVDVYEPAARELAKRVGMVVISVNYRQSPEHPHPVPFNDCLTATQYVLKNASTLKIDPSRVSISGDSAGGHLTAAVSLKLKRKIKIQIPIYPCLQLFDLQTPSYIENKEFIPGMLCDVSMLSYWLNYGNINYDHMDLILANQHTSQSLKQSKYADYVSPRWYMNEYIRDENLRNMVKPNNFGNEALSKSIESTILDPYFAPLMVSDEKLQDLPHTYVLTAGYDVLRDDGLIYYQRCKHAGVNVQLAHYQDGFHGMIFFFAGPMPFKVGIRAMDDLVNFLKENL